MYASVLSLNINSLMKQETENEERFCTHNVYFIRQLPSLGVWQHGYSNNRCFI